MKIVGYSLRGQDNGTVMFKDTEAKPLCPVSTAFLLPEEREALYDNTARDTNMPRTCPSCGWRLDFQAHNPKYTLRSTRRDISATYDGQLIVSKRFRDFCVDNNYVDMQFLPFENDLFHYHMIVDEVVKFDAVRRETKFTNKCDTCGNFQSIIGADPTFLLVNKPLADKFYRTDILFASGNDKHPLIIVGIETKAKLKAAGLKGIDFSPAYGIEYGHTAH